MRILILVLGCLVWITSYSQIQPNTLLLGASFKASSEEQIFWDLEAFPPNNSTNRFAKFKTNTSSAPLKLGWIVKKNWTVGLSFQYSINSTRVKYWSIDGNPQEVDYELSAVGSEYSLGGFASRFIKVQKKTWFHFTLNPYFSIGNSKDFDSQRANIDDSPIIVKGRSSKLGLSASTGILYQPVSWLGLQVKFINFNIHQYSFNNDLTEKFKETLVDIKINPLRWEYGVLFFIKKQKNSK